MSVNTVAASATAHFVVPSGSILVVSGEGSLDGSGVHRSLSASAQTLGPFRDDMSFDLVATGESRYQIFDLHRNRDSLALVNDGGSNHNIGADEIGGYIRMVGSGAKTVTFRPDATEPLPQNGEWHIRNAAGSGDVTLVEGDGVTLNVPSGGSLVLSPGMTVTVKRIDADVFDVIGQTVAA